MKAENSDRIRRALSHKTRTYGAEVYQSGDKVYFRRGNEKNWKGPTNVWLYSFVEERWLSLEMPHEQCAKK